MKEIDYPIYSAVIMIGFVICLNYITVFDTVNYFVYHDRWPGKWNYWIPLTIILVFYQEFPLEVSCKMGGCNASY